MKLGIAGNITRLFIASPLTTLFLLASFALGLVALVTLPREDAAKLVTEPLETIVKSIDGVEHVYSQTQDDGILVTARFLAGTSSDAAILRVHEKIRANMDCMPVGIPEPLIVGRGIDDVAIVVVTLTPTAEAASRWTANDLTRLARELQVEVAKLPNRRFKPFLPDWDGAPGRPAAHPCGRSDPAEPARDRQSSSDRPRRAPGLCT